MHTGFAGFEFVVEMHQRPRSHLHLPDSFTTAVENNAPTGFWLQVDGCPNGPPWVWVDYTVDHSMVLGRGWKSFACSRHVTRGQYVAFQYDGDKTLSMKIFGAPGGRVDCFVESESSSGPSLDDEDEDEESSSDIKAEGDPSSSG